MATCNPVCFDWPDLHATISSNAGSCHSSSASSTSSQPACGCTQTGRPSLMGSRQSCLPRARVSAMGCIRHNYIAVIDDDLNHCRSMSRLLRAAHFQPITYLSAEEFLADAKRPQFDCLVLDIQLKGMSGVDLSQRLSAVNDATPIVFVTAHDDPELRAQLEASHCAYFRKTESGSQIIAAIHRLIGLSDSGSAGKPGKPADPEPNP